MKWHACFALCMHYGQCLALTRGLDTLHALLFVTVCVVYMRLWGSYIMQAAQLLHCAAQITGKFDSARLKQNLRAAYVCGHQQANGVMMSSGVVELATWLKTAPSQRALC
jgi:hypothetical protein